MTYVTYTLGSFQIWRRPLNQFANEKLLDSNDVYLLGVETIHLPILGNLSNVVC